MLVVLIKIDQIRAEVANKKKANKKISDLKNSSRRNIMKILCTRNFDIIIDEIWWYEIISKFSSKFCASVSVLLSVRHHYLDDVTHSLSQIATSHPTTTNSYPSRSAPQTPSTCHSTPTRASCPWSLPIPLNVLQSTENSNKWPSKQSQWVNTSSCSEVEPRDW